jgi:hypothetical protein
MFAKQSMMNARILLGGSTTKRSFGAMQKAAADQKFLTPAANAKTMYFDNLKGVTPAKIAIDNLYRHHNDLPLSQ